MFLVAQLTIIFVIYYFSFKVSGEALKDAVFCVVRNAYLPDCILWTKPLRQPASSSECGMYCLTDIRCVSFTVDFDEGTCMGHNQTFLDELVYSPYYVNFFYTKSTATPTELTDTVTEQALTTTPLTTSTATPVPTTRYVPPGFTTGMNGQLVYFLDPNEVNQHQAVSTCGHSGGRLIHVYNDATMDFVKTLAGGVANCVYINGRKEAGAWTYKDGNEIETFFWGDDQPDQTENDDICLVVSASSGMNDVFCDTLCQAICEYV